MTTALAHAQEMGISKRAKPTYGYYRQPNGWITVSVMTDLEELKYRREGWEPLHQYGRFEMNSAYTADHPLETLFMLGGAHELSLEQIVKTGLFLNPPLVPTCRRPLDQDHKRHSGICMEGARPVEFPQIEGLALEGQPCHFCENDPYPTVEARDQHEKVAHKDEKSDIRTGETLANAMVRGLKSDGSPVTKAADGADPLAVLANVGLNKTQIAALRAAGIEVSSGDEEPS